jgi:hypothetical protein
MAGKEIRTDELLDKTIRYTKSSDENDEHFEDTFK